jgi:hypothetical protein
MLIYETKFISAQSHAANSDVLDKYYLSEQMTHEVRSRDRAAFLLGIRGFTHSTARLRSGDVQ